MNTIHDEMIKRFNEKYIEIYGTLYDAKSAVIKSFFLSEIDIAVKQERERIVKIIEPYYDEAPVDKVIDSINN